MTLEGSCVSDPSFFARERALASAVQAALERVYQLDHVADVESFIGCADEGERECLSVCTADDGVVEIALRLPHLARPAFDIEDEADLDPLCQLIEGVSHFVYLSDRVSEGRATTQLELEFQAEVDKYIVLASSLSRLTEGTLVILHDRLFEDIRFRDDPSTEEGARYRLAHTLAARFVRHLERSFVIKGRFRELREELRRFYRMGQEEKLRLGLAA